MTLSEFLLKLAADPHLLERFREEPRKVADEIGLDEEQRRLLAAGSLEQLRIEIHGELRVGEETAMIVWLHRFPSIPWLFAASDDAES
jgi:hypothetical protein